MSKPTNEVKISRNKFWSKYGFFTALACYEDRPKDYNALELRLFMSMEDSGSDFCWDELSYGLDKYFNHNNFLREVVDKNRGERK